MKIRMMVAFATMMLMVIGCQNKKGNNNNRAQACNTAPVYDNQGRLVSGCANFNQYGYGGQYGQYGYPNQGGYPGQQPYGYPNQGGGYPGQYAGFQGGGYNGYGGSDPCQMYNMQLGGQYYYPAMVGGQWMCVLAQ